MAAWTIESSQIQTYYRSTPIRRELYCDSRRHLQIHKNAHVAGISQEKSLAPRENLAQRKSLMCDVDKRFTLEELDSSVVNGCQSCRVYRRILGLVSLIDPVPAKFTNNSTFSISAEFAIRKEIMVGDVHKVQEVALYHPEGTIPKFTS